ncbi:hypothetical protein F2Q68_00037667 [Brassica cretica]|uniref:Oberon coiled-coil region domain-containing protein n=1 Tax=Brassica cretica TaxID=69181 RepID=A0A8S9H729_BRACR|nr:hypothetical protein F2Q68_00037667 [Brassica cretica]
MDLKTSKMILLDKHMRAMVSDFSLSKLAVDKAFHVSGILSRAQLDIWSPSVGVEAISNEHFQVDYTRCASDSTSGCLQAATIQSSIFAWTYRLMARTGKHSNLGNGWLWMNSLRRCDTTSKCFSTASVTISGEKKAQSTWLSGTYTWLSRLHNRELEDKAKEVSELKTERHKKKLNIDELEGIARLNLAEAAMCVSDSTSGCLQAATIQSSIFARTYRLMARTGKHSNLGNGWLWMNPLRSCDTTSKCFSTASVTISGEKKAQSTWLSGTYTWLSKLHNRELEDKAKEVPELKIERHKKKLNIDELEGIARLNLAEAAILRRNAQVTSEQRLAKAEAERQYMFEKIKLTENSSSHHKVVVVEETRAYTWLSRLHNRELEDKAKEVPELKTERHKKKLNIDELEGIARLNLAEAAML